MALISAKGGSAGSGVVVDSEGLILSAAHVVAAMSERITVIFPDGTRRTAKALGADSEIGIGTNDSGRGYPDWTHSNSASNYAIRNLYVLARPGGTASGPAPEILAHPCDRTTAPGGDVTFAVTCSGEGPFDYQWRFDGIPITGATLPWLELNAVSHNGAGDYDVVITGPNLVSSISLAGTLTVAGSPLSIISRWQLDHFGTTDSDGAAAVTSDLGDLDTLINLLEFAFGTDPNLADRRAMEVDGSVNGLPVVQVTNDGDGSIDALFNRRDDHGRPGSLDYTAQFSSDLMVFYDHPTAPTILADSTDDPAYEVVKVPFPATLPDGREPRFFRVLVELIP